MINKLISFTKKHWVTLVFLAITFALFVLNSRYVDYPDEYINLLAGKTILNGGLPYVDFWDHHLPLAWYSGALLLLLSGQSFVVTRLLWTLVQFVSFAFLGKWIQKNHPSFLKPFAAFFMLYPALSLYFWLHLFLADGMAIFFFSIAFWILLVKTFDNKGSNKILYLSSFLLFCMIFSSATFLYIGAVMYLWHAYLLNFRFGRPMWKLIGWSIIPYALFILYFAVTGTLNDFYFANFVYNTKYYISIPNYVRGANFNPLKFAMTLIANFWEGYLPLLTKIKHFDLYLPVGTLAGIGTFSLLFILWSRNWILGLMFFFVLTFSAPRSGLETFNETDYQSGTFLVLGLISSLIVLKQLFENRSKQEGVGDLQRVVRFTTFVFLLFTAVFLLFNSYNVAYKLYTQKLPTIHNAGPGAMFLDEILNEGDAYFIGPYEPHESFYVKKGEWNGKHPSLLPQFREGEELRQSFMSQFEENPPKVIIYKQEASIFQTPSLEFGKFFLDWMSDKYTRLENVPGVEVLKSPTGMNIRGDLNIRNQDLEEVLGKLRDFGYISSTASAQPK